MKRPQKNRRAAKSIDKQAEISNNDAGPFHGTFMSLSGQGGYMATVLRVAMTIDDLTSLALQKAGIAEARQWISELKRRQNSRAIFGDTVSPYSVVAVCYGISIVIVRAILAGNNVEEDGHRFIELIRALAEERGVCVKKVDNIDALKYTFAPSG